MLSSYHMLGYLVHWHGYGYWDSDVSDSSDPLVRRVDDVCLHTSSNEKEEVDDEQDDGERKQGSQEIA